MQPLASYKDNEHDNEGMRLLLCASRRGSEGTGAGRAFFVVVAEVQGSAQVDRVGRIVECRVLVQRGMYAQVTPLSTSVDPILGSLQGVCEALPVCLLRSVTSYHYYVDQSAIGKEGGGEERAGEFKRKPPSCRR